MNKVISEMVDMYHSGRTIKHISEAFNISTGKVYNLLRDARCEFRKRGHQPGWKPTQDMIEKSVKKRRGKKWNAESRKRLSEARKSSFDGLNGYGHTKNHPRGYVLAYAPLHPNAHKDGYVMLHTVVMEQSIGRYLNHDETVHHKNHIRNDNRIENLELMNRHEHFSMHMKERYRKDDDLSISAF